MIRHILFWKYTDNIKAEHKEEWALHFLQDSVATMDGKVDGLLKIEMTMTLYSMLNSGTRNHLRRSGNIRFMLHTGSAVRI